MTIGYIKECEYKEKYPPEQIENSGKTIKHNPQSHLLLK